ncbi:DUF2189 domain-containing protein [Delftia sp. PS-11]|uniref:DUF2189 domain-containing protein n=1 Tax=Delftia sp. PS-11 TaxID=2767222 RepID=UPI0024542CDD|nr:DUF2189 domain-containing protein [Delftia sp. PS-11]KAJ8740770.1 DUF2189 domain-containing protein [Delftia sp. PS-11]
MQASPASDKAPEDTSGALQVCVLRMADPWRWLALGWRDLRRAPGIALFYGACFWVMALLVGWVFRASPEYSMAMASGCLLAGPFLAMGLYDTSRRLERGEPADLGSSLTCWDTQMGAMGMLVMVLLVLEMLWARASMVVFAVFFETGMPTTAGVIQAVLHRENWEFLAVYLLVGGVFAALVFSSMVVALPAMLDRGSDALTACIASMRVVGMNFAVMLQWAAIITSLVAVSLWWWGAGLLLAGPLLGCASWHAYRSSIAGRQPAPPA